VMSQNAAAFQGLAGQPAALQAFAANAQAFATLGHDANFQNLISNAAFGAAARSQDFANAVNSN
jgi:hypothetical protein